MNKHILEKLDDSVWKVIESFEHKCEEMDKRGTVFEIDTFVVRIKVPYIAEYDIYFQKREGKLIRK